MGSQNLWGITDDSEFLHLKRTEKIPEIMKEQCQYLKESTKGTVLAKFAKIKLVRSMALSSDALKVMSGIASAFATTEVVGEESTAALEDANALYNEFRYGFEIYNQIYKFRVFEMQLGPAYPVNIVLDEGINESVKDLMGQVAKATEINGKYEIDSDATFMNCLRIIFQSKKVQFIIFRMKEMANKAEE